MECSLAYHHLRRVLLVDDGRPAHCDLTDWLRELPGLRITGPWPNVGAAMTPARLFLPHAVILRLVNPAAALGGAVRKLKALTPRPRVYLVSPAVNELVRRQAGGADIDEVFDRNYDLEELAQRLIAPRANPFGVAQRHYDLRCGDATVLSG